MDTELAYFGLLLQYIKQGMQYEVIVFGYFISLWDIFVGSAVLDIFIYFVLGVLYGRD